jgi:predicted DNA-binding protein
MSTQLIVRLDEDLKSKITKLAKAEGKTTSEVVRDLVRNYVQERDIEGYIDDLWARIGKKLKARNVRSRDIARAVKKARARAR